MTLSESDRRQIFVGLEPILGVKAADNLMSLLPHQPAAQLATREDVQAIAIALRGEMAETKGEMKGEMAELKLTMQRWMSGAMAVNTVALITALVT